MITFVKEAGLSLREIRHNCSDGFAGDTPAGVRGQKPTTRSEGVELPAEYEITRSIAVNFAWTQTAGTSPTTSAARSSAHRANGSAACAGPRTENHGAPGSGSGALPESTRRIVWVDPSKAIRPMRRAIRRLEATLRWKAVGRW